MLCFVVGDCLITAATGSLGDMVAERAGLVPTHAYAVLDIKKIQVSVCQSMSVKCVAFTVYVLHSLAYHSITLPKLRELGIDFVIRIDIRFYERQK